MHMCACNRIKNPGGDASMHREELIGAHHARAHVAGGGWHSAQAVREPRAASGPVNRAPPRWV